MHIMNINYHYDIEFSSRIDSSIEKCKRLCMHIIHVGGFYYDCFKCFYNNRTPHLSIRYLFIIY